MSESGNFSQRNGDRDNPRHKFTRNLDWAETMRAEPVAEVVLEVYNKLRVDSAHMPRYQWFAWYKPYDGPQHYPLTTRRAEGRDPQA